MLHPDLPNLIFIGRTATYLNILTDCLQARWLAELITGRFRLPSREAMLAEYSRFGRMIGRRSRITASERAPVIF